MRRSAVKKNDRDLPVCANIARRRHGCIAAFATLATRDGFTVCTAVHGTETLVASTRPIGIPFDLMISFCNRAGNVVSLRSGIGEILSSSTARKSYLCNGDEFARFENPNAYGMCDCSNSVYVKKAG